MCVWGRVGVELVVFCLDRRDTEGLPCRVYPNVRRRIACLRRQGVNNNHIELSDYKVDPSVVKFLAIVSQSRRHAVSTSANNPTIQLATYPINTSKAQSKF